MIPRKGAARCFFIALTWPITSKAHFKGNGSTATADPDRWHCAELLAGVSGPNQKRSGHPCRKGRCLDWSECALSRWPLGTDGTAAPRRRRARSGARWRVVTATRPPVAARADGGPGAGVAGRVQAIPRRKGPDSLAMPPLGGPPLQPPARGRRRSRGGGADKRPQEGEHVRDGDTGEYGGSGSEAR